MLYALLLLALAATLGAVFLYLRLRRVESAHSDLTQEHQSLSQEKSKLEDRVRGVVDADAERARVLAEIDADRERARIQRETEAAEHQRMIQGYQEQRRNSQAELFNLELSLSKLREEFSALDEEANLQSFGFYRPHYDFASSERYQKELERIREQQKWMIKEKAAAVCPVEWTVNGDRAAGRKSTNQTLKLMLRAFNGESDAAIAKVRYNNVHVMEARIRKAWEAINATGGVQQCSIVPTYMELKLQELRLAHEYQEKLQEEKEEQRRIREQMREEELALRELERARVEAEREEQRYETALRKATVDAERAVGDKQQKLLGQIEELQRRLEEAHANKERAIAQAQLTRSGHVYVISNVGSFGEDVFKIGMTRRLDPMDRVRELGDASVPFQFDVHAIIYSEDAPALETKLHRAFHQRRINRVNERKEFFKVGIDEIAEAVRQFHGEIEIVRDAEAVDFRKTLAAIEAGYAAPLEGSSQPVPASRAAPNLAHAAEKVAGALSGVATPSDN